LAAGKAPGGWTMAVFGVKFILKLLPRPFSKKL